MQTHIQKNVYIYLIAAMFFWGVAWPSSKVLTEYTDSYTLTFLKFFLSSISLIPMLYFSKQKLIFSKKIFKYLVLSVIVLILYNVLFFLGLKVGFAGFGGMLVTGSNPIFTFLIVAMLEKVDIPREKKIPLGIGILGTVIMLDLYNNSIADLMREGNILFLLSSVVWSILTILNATSRKYVGTLVFTFYLYIASSLVSYVFFVPNEKVIQIFEFDYIFWINLLFTTVVSTGIATTFYFKASTIIGANQASSFIFLVPLVAMASSNIIYSEVPSFSTLLGGVLMIYTVWRLNKKVTN
ncbi:DMT family transporter [Sulfurimonas lithotrophica]|uniref:DMT family transporter n=1 Tax=Sulfurimonas lithotrophica TaxID=2590022 RepID=A0A5P8NZR0_9BACT|nr:DMT family transporter [Sulfurimonas lithotrophica]QFR48837.1 DMT family transporter [Sulfurimonas lithotrophica]